MFGLFAPETVTYLDLHAGVLAFLSKKKRAPGNCKVRLVIPQSPKPLTLDLPVAIFTVRRYSVGSVCVAHVMVDESRYPALEGPIKSIPVPAELKQLSRRAPRYPASLRVICRELPGYGAVTSDIGLYGLRLSTHGKVADGTNIRFTLVLDIGTVDPNVQLEGKTIWCAPDPKSKGCLVGVAFQNIDASRQETMQSYIKSLAYRLSGDVMHRSIADGEVFVRGDDNVSKN